jgi:hypothetical protein
LFLLYFLLWWFPAFSQKDYARKIVDTLAGPYFQGRCYEDSGIYKAGRYIISQFRKLGLRPVQGSYRQTFHTDINIFPETPFVQLDDRTLTPAIDYQVEADAPKIHGTFQCVFYHRANLPGRKEIIKLVENGFFKNKAVLIDDRNPKSNYQAMMFSLMKENICQAPLIVNLTDSQLTWWRSPFQSNAPAITISRVALQAKHPKTITVDIKSKLLKHVKFYNVIGYIPGTVSPDSFIVFTAHYDHLGKMGKEVYYPGANDNSSGVAMLLSVAKYYASHPPAYSVCFIAFAGEEMGLIGSKYYVEHPLFPLRQIAFLIRFLFLNERNITTIRPIRTGRIVL